MSSCWAISLAEKPRANKSLTWAYCCSLAASRARRFRSALARGGLPPLLRCRQIRRRKRRLLLPKLFVTARDLCFDRLHEVFHQVKTVRDLNRLRSAFTGPLGVIFPTIPTHIGDFRVLAHPVGGALRGTFC